MMLHKGQLHFATFCSGEPNYPDGDRLFIEPYQDPDPDTPDEPYFRICVEDDDSRFEVRTLTLDDLRLWRDTLDAFIRAEEAKADRVHRNGSPEDGHGVDA